MTLFQTGTLLCLVLCYTVASNHWSETYGFNSSDQPASFPNEKTKEIGTIRLKSGIDLETCIDANDETPTDWAGIADSALGVMSHIPEVGEIFGWLGDILGIFHHSSGQDPDYLKNMGDCIDMMINNAILTNNLAHATDTFTNMNGYLKEFTENIGGTLSHSNMQLAKEELDKIEVETNQLKKDFHQGGQADYKHEAFVFLLLDGLSILGLARLAFTQKLKEWVTEEDFEYKCSLAEYMVNKQEFTLSDMFESNGDFSIQSTLDNSDFHLTWPNSANFETSTDTSHCSYCCGDRPHCSGGTIRGTARDKYRLKYETTCSRNCKVSEFECNFGPCTGSLVSNGIDYAKSQYSLVKSRVDNAKKSQQKILDLIIENTNDICNPPQQCTWTKGSSCYNIETDFSNHGLTHDEAVDFCADTYDGFLVAPSTQDEQEFLEKELNLLMNSDNALAASNRVWIGLVKDGDTWSWENGEHFDFENFDGDNGKPFTYMHGDRDWTWHQNDLAHYFPLCESEKH